MVYWVRSGVKRGPTLLVQASLDMLTTWQWHMTASRKTLSSLVESSRSTRLCGHDARQSLVVRLSFSLQQSHTLYTNIQTSTPYNTLPRPAAAVQALIHPATDATVQSMIYHTHVKVLFIVRGRRSQGTLGARATFDLCISNLNTV